MMQHVDKNRPSAEWIESLRRRFPVEREIDRILTRKLKGRAGPPYRPVQLQELVDGVGGLIRSQVDGPFEIVDARWLSGGASKLQMAFGLDWERPGVGYERTQMVLRMEPAESIVETSRFREVQLIKAFEGIVPVPPVFWCDANGEFLPYPALIYGFAPGVTKPADARSGVSGLGTHLPVELRAKLAPQFVDHLAKIHTRDLSACDLSAFDVPKPGTQTAEWSINWSERVWEEDSDEDVPLMRLAAAWLRSRMPSLQRPSVVHSDYRVGNFLYTEHDARISAWLDWELGHIGDPHQDLAWTTSRAFGHFDESGKNFLVCGLMPEAQFLEEYERSGGYRVDPKALHWYKIYNDYMLAAMTLGTSYRIARNGKTHQDVLLAWIIGVGYTVIEEMRTLIEQEG